VREELRQHGDPDKASGQIRFFKCGPGEYGEGDQFLGVSVPKQRKIAKQYRRLPLKEVGKLLSSPLHECRLTALLILVEIYNQKKIEEATRKAIVDMYVRNTEYINNWDLVDSSAHYILGPWLIEYPEQREILYRLARSEHLWQQRIAIITTFAFIRERDFSDTFALADILLHHPHDLIHKAVGWMLREIGNRDRGAEELFLKPRYRTMPRTMLRYAIEKFPEPQRKAYLKGEIE
jgi:3-methyladenine DNA glycosylase AlkD